jgi:isopenicillin-N N-acyltransferase like protein
LPDASANGHLWLGQNWDWIPQVRGAVVHTRGEDEVETLGFTEAGVFGAKIGINSAGLGLAINGMVSNVDDWSRPALPFHVRCYDILRSRTLDEARAVVTAQARPCAANFLLAQSPDRAIDIEAAPETVRVLTPEEDALVHANHFLEPRLLGVEEPPSERRPHSYARQSRMRALLDARRPVGLGDLESALRDHDDHPDGICRHENSEDPPEERYITVASVIMDLDERSVWLTDGQPCEHLYDGYSLAHTALLGR